MKKRILTLFAIGLAFPTASLAESAKELALRKSNAVATYAVLACAQASGLISRSDLQKRMAYGLKQLDSLDLIEWLQRGSGRKATLVALGYTTPDCKGFTDKTELSKKIVQYLYD